MRALEASLLIIDFETTGTVQNYASEPWQIGCVSIEQGKINPDKSFTSLLRIGERPFHPQAPGSHHQLRKELKQAPSMQMLWSKLSPMLTKLPWLRITYLLNAIFFPNKPLCTLWDHGLIPYAWHERSTKRILLRP